MFLFFNTKKNKQVHDKYHNKLKKTIMMMSKKSNNDLLAKFIPQTFAIIDRKATWLLKSLGVGRKSLIICCFICQSCKKKKTC